MNRRRTLLLSLLTLLAALTSAAGPAAATAQAATTPGSLALQTAVGRSTPLASASVGSHPLRSGITGRVATLSYDPNALATGVAAKAGAAPVRLGQAGERAVREAYDIGPKVPITIGGRTRIPDALTSTTLSEIKNVASLSYTRQLREYAQYAQQTGRTFDLYVRHGTSISGPLQRAADLGELQIIRALP